MEHKTKTWKFWENLMKLSINKTQECVDEWENIDVEEFCKYDDTEDDEKCDECICSQKHLIHIHYFKNKYNDNVVRIGSKCIKQFLKNQYEILENERDQLMIEKKEIRKIINQRCERCKSHLNSKNDIIKKKDNNQTEKYKCCDKCLFINNYAYSRLNDGYIKWLRIKEKEDFIIPNDIRDRQIRFLNLRESNEKEILKLEKKYLDIEKIIINNYNL